MSTIQAVIFDWAGTMIDHGSLAPMGVFVETFAQFGVKISIDEARIPMGMAKRPHIAALMAMPRIAQAWTDTHGHAPSEADIDAVYAVFVPKNLEIITNYAELIEGAAAVVAQLRSKGIKIGSSTGYTREIMAKLLPVAAQQGYAPDSLVCTGDTAQGRPTPLMLYKNMLDLGVWPAWHVVKVDDTVVGIEEGLNGGAWSVGVSVSGNCFGLSLNETRALSGAEFARRKAEAEQQLLKAGAHYVIDSVADLMPVIAHIEGRIARGERP